MNFPLICCWGSLLLLCMGCHSPPSYSPLLIAQLGKGATGDFEAIQSAFSQNNPGYQLAYFPQASSIPASASPRLFFVQTGGGRCSIAGGTWDSIGLGDVLILPQGQNAQFDQALNLLGFSVPSLPADSIPSIIRPDWDPNITDIPGGCATDSNAYRRILLTWKQGVGKYLYHDLNAHRVRIMDSFTHYHPLEGGFDEFYLVQMALPDARLLSSSHTEKIIHPDEVQREEIDQLLQSTPLNVGDLVYLPRGTIHRGLGGVLAQVITVPGFIPGAEIGVDHHLRILNERFHLPPEQALPFHRAAAQQPLIK